MKTATFALAIFLAGVLQAAKDDATSWDKKAAEAYLDARQNWWMTWPNAARDQGTFCVSCHTALPYALVRPALRGGETMSATEAKFVDNVTKRVRMWNEAKPFYPDKTPGDPKTAQSRGTEAIMNALVLATHDAGEGRMSDDTRTAFANMWGLQEKNGGWSWLNFHNAPWEADDSQFYGVSLAAIAVGSAPGDYRSSPAIQENVKQLREFLSQGAAAQSPLNRVVLLWASVKLPGILTSAQQKKIVDETLAKQQEDGGWSLSTVVGTWKRKDGTPMDPRSDGYATGLVTYALQEAGIPRTQEQMKRGLAWLGDNQDKKEGMWMAYSLNKQRDPASDIGRFMVDAATSYAALSLLHK
jgi:squalene-hopene/tetraprenyl-beta-curcumene cyclase